MFHPVEQQAQLPVILLIFSERFYLFVFYIGNYIPFAFLSFSSRRQESDMHELEELLDHQYFLRISTVLFR